MRKTYLYPTAYLLLFSVFFCSSCSSQSGSVSSGSKDTETETPPSAQLPSPRVDSVLEFESIITAMFEDSKGNFWIGSHCDGLCRYDGQQYTYFTVEQGLPGDGTTELNNRTVPLGNIIRAIQEDESGNIWINTADGISRFDGQSFTTIHPEGEAQSITESFIPSADNPDEDWKKELGHLWFGEMLENGVYRYDGQRLAHLTYPFPEEDTTKSWSRYATYSLYQDRDENLWFGTESGGILRYNRGSITCINQDEQKGIVRCFFQDRSGRVWISNVTMGLCYYEEGTFHNFTHEKGYSNLNQNRSPSYTEGAPTLDGIQTIEQDEEGNLWMGTFSDGLWKYDGDALTHFTVKKNLPSNTVKTIYKDHKGKLWFGIGRGTVYGFDGDSFFRFDES